MMRRINLSSLLLLACVLSCINRLVNAQSYVPQVSPMTSCPSGQNLVTFGFNDPSLLSTNTPTTVATSNYIYTTYFNTTTPVTISQLSLGINDNLNVATVIQLRLGLMMINGLNMVRIGQSEEILLYATPRDVVYANLEQPVQLLPGVQYAIAFWSNANIYTGVDAVPTGATYNTAYVSYSPNGLPYTQAMSYTYGRRALQATGCASSNDPFNSADTTLYSFCAYAQGTLPPSPLTSYAYSRSTTTYTISGVLAVSSTQVGSSAQGTWATVVGGFATYSMSNSGPYYYPSTSPVAGKMLVIGVGTITSPNQRFYTSGNQRIDSNGISFVSADGTQFIISFTNNSVAITELSSGSMSVVTGRESTGFTAAVTPSVNIVPACSAPAAYTPDSFSCGAGEVPISFGDDSLANFMAQYSTPNTYYSYSNFVYFREFTAPANPVTLKQLTFRIFDNPGKLVKIRMAIYTAPAPAASLPPFTLLQETREVLLSNPKAGVIAINLLNNIDMTAGKNYTIAMITDHWLYTSYGYYLPVPYFYTLPYEVIAPSGMPKSIAVQYTSNVMPIGANGCARGQTMRTLEICANFVYADRINQYYGTVNVLANPINSDQGQYLLVVSGSGISNRTTTANVRTVGNWTVKSYYLPSNNRLYLSGQNNGALVDNAGLQVVVSMPSAGYAVQMASWFDPASASVEYKEFQQTYSSTTPTALANVQIADFAYRDHAEGSPVVCNAPPRPLNLVSPLSVARASCPNNANSITDVFGDTQVGDWDHHADGNTIEANRVYTTSFVAESTGTVSQLGLGLLNMANQAGEVRVRLGLYSAANNSLMVQANQLTLNQAVDQLIVMNLPYPVGVVGGQTYYIALFASGTLEVATSAAENSPSMTATFSATGLPTTFTSSGLAVSVSVAAYVCVSTTHSFCAYFQYSPASGASTTLMYQGLLQASGQPQTNTYGTYLQATAMAGRLTQYVRVASSPTNTLTLYTFALRSGTTVSLYTSSNNNMYLDTTGAILDFNNGASSNLQFNASIGKMDESFRLIDKETDLIFSGMQVQALQQGGGIPSCGLATVPRSTPADVPLPSCPADQDLVSFGDADQTDVTNNQEGLYSAPAGQIFLRQFTSHPTRSTMLHQVKFGININYNTVNRIRMGLYDANYTFMAGSNDITMYNPNDQMFTGVLSSPQYLLPNTVYNLAWWTEAAVYAGFSSVSGPAGAYPFSQPWPTIFENLNPNSQRAIAGFGCTTSVSPPSTNTQSSSSSSSSSDLSGGAVAGIVIGCVVGSNLLLLACLYLCCVGSNAGGKGTSWKPMEVEESRTAANVELGEVSTS